MGPRASALALVGALALAGAASSCADPVHDNEVSALGGEDPGVSPGPTHRPGQPCMTCHGGSGPASARFSMGGTIYKIQGQPDPLEGATVEITDAAGKKYDATTNSAGNFYINDADFEPSYPAFVTVSFGGATATMLTHIGRDGSCADCHFSPPGPTTQGPIYLAFDAMSFPGGM